QAALAERAGISLRAVQDLERSVGRPQRETARRLAEALALTAERRVQFDRAATPAPRSRQTAHSPASRTGDGGAYRQAGPIDTIRVPDTVRTVFSARIDRLEPEAKRLLQVAAVIGKDVPFSLLQAIVDVPDELDGSLTRLLATEFIYEAQLFPELVYTFKHALTHEVAYGSLLQERRRTLHARIVDAIERSTEDRIAEQVDALGYHAVRGELWDKAVAYLRRAGQRDSARSASRQAARDFEQALDALNHLPNHRAAWGVGVD